MRTLIAGAITAATVLLAGTAEVGAVPTQWTTGPGANNHFYEFVPFQGQIDTWTESRADALARTYLGMGGYLATVISAEESSFLSSLSTATAYIGGSDVADEGVWIWVDGPEAGQVFWNGGPASSGGSAPAGAFANWFPNEPNNLGNEDFINMSLGSGQWNDAHDFGGFTTGYFVEFNAASTDIPEPTTLAALGLGLLGMGILRRRRRA